MVTVESAIGIAAILFVVFGSALVLLAVGAHVRCVDGAREAARLAARGDLRGARSASARVAPAGAQISVDESSGLVTARVVFRAPVFSTDLGATAVAAVEPVAGP